MLDRIQRVLIHGHSLYLVDGEVEPFDYVTYLLAQRYKAKQIKRIIHRLPRSATVPKIPIVALVHRGAVIGYRASKWIGQRYARIRELRLWLRSDGFSTGEIAAFLALAKCEPVTRLKSLIQRLDYGIRP